MLAPKSRCLFFFLFFFQVSGQLLPNGDWANKTSIPLSDAWPAGYRSPAKFITFPQWANPDFGHFDHLFAAVLLLLEVSYSRYRGSRCSVCLSNSKQLSHHQTVRMTSPYFDFDAVAHSIKDVSVSTRQSLASSELFRIHG